MIFKGLIFLLFFSIQSFGQYEIPNKPKAQKAVYQFKKILNDSDENSLNHKLVKYSDSTSTQIVVVSIDSTKGENVLFLGSEWAQKWGIGQKGLDNGILILIAVDDRRLAINTGYGIEEFLTDARSKRIIDNTITPNFKESEFYKGLDIATDQIIEILAGNFDSIEETKSEENDFSLQLIILFGFLFMFFYPIIPAFNEFKKRKNDGQDVIFWDIYRDYAFNDGGIYHPSGRFSSPFSGSGGGDGFGGGFGGGGFGGGGASGGW